MQLRDKKYKLLLITFIILGIFVRSVHLLNIELNLPVHSGGLFLFFSENIASNDFQIPKTIPYYSEGGIPFAYPPLGFYIIAVLITIFKIPGFIVINVLPVVISCISVGVFYFVSKLLSNSKIVQCCLVLVYSILPSAFQQQIEDEGTAEALGTLALLLLLYFSIKVFYSRRIKDFILLGISGALCIISAPGSAYAGAILLTLSGHLLLIIAPNKMYTFKALMISSCIVLILTSAYWFPVIRNHGIEIFTTTLSAQHPDSTGVYKIIETYLSFNISSAKHPFFWNTLIALGAFLTIATKKAFIVIILAILMLIPRESPWLISIPGSFLGGYGLAHIIQILQKDAKKSIYYATLSSVVIVALVSYGGLQAYYASSRVANLQRPDRTRATLAVSDWIHDHTDTSARFIILDSYLREWTPRLFLRTVLNVPQGTEWKPTVAENIRGFNEYVSGCVELQCVYNSTQKYFERTSFFIYSDQAIAKTFLNNSETNSAYNYKVVYKEDKFLIGQFIAR